MNIRTGNYLTKAGQEAVIKVYQQVAYQILYGNYIDKEFKKIAQVLDYKEFSKKYGAQVSALLRYDVAYYRITETECNQILQFLNSNLELVCGVETIPEGEGFN